jgi:hypothetical protein
MEDQAMWSTVEMNDVQQTMSWLELHSRQDTTADERVEPGEGVRASGAVFADCHCR